MINATETAIRQIIIFPADFEPDQPGVAYGDVEYKGRRYSIQYSRPRHPSNIGQVLSDGVAVYTDDGHDDNANFARALGDDVDFAAVVEHIAFVARAEEKLAASVEQANASMEHIPGYASQVWGGFVWIDGDGNEQRWSKRETKEACEAVVLETCNRLGIEEAFA